MCLNHQKIQFKSRDQKCQVTTYFTISSIDPKTLHLGTLTSLFYVTSEFTHTLEND